MIPSREQLLAAEHFEAGHNTYVMQDADISERRGGGGCGARRLYCSSVGTDNSQVVMLRRRWILASQVSFGIHL